jgi:hypothetical protein
MSRTFTSEPGLCLSCSTPFARRQDLAKAGRGNFCSIRCANEARKGKVNEAAMVTEYQLSRIGIKSLAKKYGVGQPRAESILRSAGIDTSLGKRRNAKGVACSTYRNRAAKGLGRELLPKEVVHHIDIDRSNNVPENLAVMSDTTHRRLHRNMDRLMSKMVKRGLLTFDRTTNQYTMSEPIVRLMED